MKLTFAHLFLVCPRSSRTGSSKKIGMSVCKIQNMTQRRAIQHNYEQFPLFSFFTFSSRNLLRVSPLKFTFYALYFIYNARINFLPFGVLNFFFTRMLVFSCFQSQAPHLRVIFIIGSPFIFVQGKKNFFLITFHNRHKSFCNMICWTTAYSLTFGTQHLKKTYRRVT